MIGLIVSILVIGLLAGALARLLVPGKQNISVVMTIVLGVVGSFVGGFLGYLLFGKDSAEGFLQPSGNPRLGHRRRRRPADLAQRRTTQLGS